MVHYTNNSVLSKAEAGLWAGIAFVLTAAICMICIRISGVYRFSQIG